MCSDMASTMNSPRIACVYCFADAGNDAVSLHSSTHWQDLHGMQVGFFDVVALPLLRAIAAITPCGRTMLDVAMNNYEYWKESVTPIESTPASTAASTPKGGNGPHAKAQEGD